MQELKDAYATQDDIHDERPIRRVVPTPVEGRKLETDFYSRWAPKDNTGKTYQEVMQDIEARHGEKLCVRVEAKSGVVVDAVPGVAAPEGAALYIKDLLESRGCHGHYKIYNRSEYGAYVSYNFDRQLGSECPLCHEAHDGYNFAYKVKKGQYGGWKCWKADSTTGADWESHYKYPDFQVLE